MTTISSGSKPAPRFTRFLWWLAAAEPFILAKTPTEQGRYNIIGLSVLATWAFATLAWTYFFSTVMSGTVVAVALGLFMGFIILTIDRALIKGIQPGNKKKLLPLLFRGLLAITIGTFMAQPAVLYVFNKDIQVQVSLDNEQRKLQQRQQSDSLYRNRKNELLEQQAVLAAEKDARYTELSEARQAFISETDGTGGTGKVGVKDVALAKKENYLNLEAAWQVLALQNQSRAATLTAALDSIERTVAIRQEAFARQLNDGFLTRVQALNNLLKGNTALLTRYLLILFILVLIELLPVLAKTMLSSPYYEQQLALQQAANSKLQQQAVANEQALREQYMQLAQAYDAKALEEFFALGHQQQQEKLQHLFSRWKEDDLPALNGLWQQTKAALLAGQEY